MVAQIRYEQRTHVIAEPRRHPMFWTIAGTAALLAIMFWAGYQKSLENDARDISQRPVEQTH
jgi:type VI protein secretion system component VasF